MTRIDRDDPATYRPTYRALGHEPRYYSGYLHCIKCGAALARLHPNPRPISNDSAWNTCTPTQRDPRTVHRRQQVRQIIQQHRRYGWEAVGYQSVQHIAAQRLLQHAAVDTEWLHRRMCEAIAEGIPDLAHSYAMELSAVYGLIAATLDSTSEPAAHAQEQPPGQIP